MVWMSPSKYLQYFDELIILSQTLVKLCMKPTNTKQVRIQYVEMKPSKAGSSHLWGLIGKKEQECNMHYLN